MSPDFLAHTELACLGIRFPRRFDWYYGDFCLIVISPGLGLGGMWSGEGECFAGEMIFRIGQRVLLFPPHVTLYGSLKKNSVDTVDTFDASDTLDTLETLDARDTIDTMDALDAVIKWI